MKRAIRSVIILVINKSDSRCARMIIDRIGLQSNQYNNSSLFQALGSWGRAKTSEKKRGRTKARSGGRACKTFFNDPLLV